MLLPILIFALISAAALRATYVWAYNAGLKTGTAHGAYLALMMCSDEQVEAAYKKAVPPSKEES